MEHFAGDTLGVKGTIPADAARSLGLEIVGDQALVTVQEVMPNGDVVVADTPKEPDDMPMAPMPMEGSNPVNPVLSRIEPSGSL